MADKSITGTVSHQAREIQELRADPELATEYLKAAIEALNAPADRAVGLAAFGTVARMIAEEGDVKPLNAIDQAWIALAQRRVDEIHSGTAQTFDAQQVLDEERFGTNAGRNQKGQQLVLRLRIREKREGQHLRR